MWPGMVFMISRFRELIHRNYVYNSALAAGHKGNRRKHYGDVIMGAIASQITSLTIVYSIVYSDADQRKHQSYASLAFVRGIHRRPVNSPHKWPVTLKMFPFDDVIMIYLDLNEDRIHHTTITIALHSLWLPYFGTPSHGQPLCYVLIVIISMVYSLDLIAK